MWRDIGYIPALLSSLIILVFIDGCKKDDNLNLIKDIDGNIYKTVKIGNRVWFAENLKTTRLNDGTPITNLTDAATLSDLVNPAFCWYNHDEASYKNVYGALYNWYAVNTGKLCPEGWHVPTYEEWDSLAVTLGGYNVAGYKMKETGTTHWRKTDSKVTNESGFTGLPGGIMMSVGRFRSLSYAGYFWSATEFDIDFAWMFYLIDLYGSLYKYHPIKTGGASVRCIKDNSSATNNTFIQFF